MTAMATGGNMTGTPVQIVSRHDMSIIDIDRLEDRLYDHNRRATGSSDGKGLAFVALDEQSVQIGAIAGYSWARMAEIKQLWVDEIERGRGLGRGLLEAAIAEAVVRGCQSIWVMSYDFQAPNFYERLGFRREAELADWPPGHTHIILRRRLQDDAA
jgi:GNAT superfamily N-acetyltransferase